ncbi:MAG: calcium:sodium exchange protein, partial [Bacteroidetes bacterium]|nr:calcium:sodium exchange protein [Bacteroidota bacterium]
MKKLFFYILFFAFSVLSGFAQPALYGPAPNARQMKYLQNPLAGFIHFGMNTFANTDGIEWGNDTKRPATTFNPTNGKVNTDQWVRLFQKAGFKKVILVAKHHDGFCIWPSAYTDYDIAASPYLSGQGDIVKQLS